MLSTCRDEYLSNHVKVNEERWMVDERYQKCRGGRVKGADVKWKGGRDS